MPHSHNSPNEAPNGVPNDVDQPPAEPSLRSVEVVEVVATFWRVTYTSSTTAGMHELATSTVTSADALTRLLEHLHADPHVSNLQVIETVVTETSRRIDPPSSPTQFPGAAPT